MTTAALALPATASADQQVITPGGTSPLTNIYVNDNLGCQFTHTPDTHGEFFGGTDPGSCGTEVAVDGASPNVYGQAGTSSLTPVSQPAVTGTGTTADPFSVTTVVDAGTTGIRLTQVDTYVAGQEAYRSRVTVQNTSATAKTGVLYHAADCYLGNDDHGFGFHDLATGGIYCTKTPSNSPADRIVGFVPLTAGSHFFEGNFSTNYDKVALGTSLPDTCDCTITEDNGASLSWSYSVGPAGGAGDAQTFNFATSSSPAGIITDTTPPAVSITQPAAGTSVDDATPTIAGAAGADATDQSGVTVEVFAGASDSGTPLQTKMVTRSGSRWHKTLGALAIGKYTVRASQSDAAGNVGTATRTFKVKADTTAPAVAIAQPAPGASVTDTTPTIAGRAGVQETDEPSIKVALHKGTGTSGALVASYKVKPSGAGWSVTPAAALAPGAYTVVATQSDQAGNVGTATRSFTIKAPPPANLEVTVTQSAPPILVGANLTYTVTVRNHGPGTATDVVLTDVLPEDADLPDRESSRSARAAAATKRCSRASRKMTCAVGSLANGASRSYDFVVVPRKASAMVNTASAEAAQVDPVTASNDDRAQTTAVHVPKLTRTIDAAVVKGTVRYRKRGTKKFHRLRDQVELPVGSLVDARKGRVRITSERDAKGHVQSADFYRGEFLLAQRRAQHGLTTLFLRGGSFKGCPRAGKADSLATAARKKKKKRGLWGSGHGSFRTGGRYGSATVRGTIWFTQDSCASTLFKTRRGVVTVENYVTEEKVKVPKGHRYVARAPSSVRKPKSKGAK